MKNKKDRTPPKNNCMNTYADMVTLLFCFFVLLFAMSELDAERFTAMAEALAGRNVLMRGAFGQIVTDGAGIMPAYSPPIPRARPTDPEDIVDEIAGAVADRIAQMEGMAETFRTYMAQYDLAEQVGIRVDELGEYMMITFPSGMLFDSGQAMLTPSAVDMIDYVAARLANYPGHRIAAHGHTDDVPISTVQFPSNWHLSFARAFAVVERLIYWHGFDPWMLEAVGMGEFRPVDTNATEEGRANNRRVEIIVFAQQQSLTVITD